MLKSEEEEIEELLTMVNNSLHLLCRSILLTELTGELVGLHRL